MTTTISLDEIPGPRGLPVLGNARAFDVNAPFESLLRLADEFGPIYRLVVPGGTRLIVTGPELMDELCDDARYDKKVTGGQAALRGAMGTSGLFTSDTQDPLWHRAHNILMAPFSLQAMRDYMPRMVDLASQLVDKWERLNPGEAVDVPADMTRLTLDTIALCGFGYRFNSFYREEPHPFVTAMTRALGEALEQQTRLPGQTKLMIRKRRQFQEDTTTM